LPPLRGSAYLTLPAAVPVGLPPEAQPGALTRLEPGRARAFEAQPAPGEPGRAALAQVYVVTKDDAPGPITLHVGGQAFSTLALTSPERLDVALPVGATTLSLDGPPGTVGFANLTPAASAVASLEDTANLRRYYPLAIGESPLHVHLPEARVPGPIRVALRAQGGGFAGEPVRVAIHTDVGERRTLSFIPGGRDENALPLDGAVPVSGEVTIVFRPPPGARELWLTAAQTVPLCAQVSVRRWDDPPADATSATRATTTAPSVPAATTSAARATTTAPSAPAAAATAPDTDAALARLAHLSRRLAAEPDAGELLVERAHLLLDLAQPDLARQDLARLSNAANPSVLGARADALVDRIDTASDPSFITVPGLTGPVPVAPALLALAAAPDVLRPFVPVARAARQKGAADALAQLRPGDDFLTAALHARLAAAPMELVRLYQATGSLAVGLEAADALARLLADDPAHAPRGTAALLFGLAARLRLAADHPVLRRAAVVSASASRWDSLEGTESNAGLEHLYVSDAPPTTPAGAVREALLAPPWHVRRAHSLLPGTGAALDVTLGAAGQIAADVYCQALKVAVSARCAVSVRVDGQDLRAGAVAAGELAQPAPRPLGAGRHHLEVTLGADDPNVVAQVRFLTDRPLLGVPPTEREPRGYPVAIEKPTRMWAAEPNLPVQVTVLGPATLHVETRALGAAAPAVTVRAATKSGATVSERSRPGKATLERGAAERGGAPGGAASEPATVTERLQPEPGPDPSAHGEPGRKLDVGPTAEADLLLPDAAPYRVSVAPERGRALVRVGLRVDAPGAPPPPVPPPWWENAAGSALLPWPALTPPLAPIDGEVWDASAPSSFGTLSFELSGGSQPIGDQDSALQNFEGVVQLAVTYRRQLVDDTLWLRLGPLARVRQDSAGPIFGGTFESYLKALPLDLRLDLHGGFYTEKFLGNQELSFTGGVRLDRSFQLGNGLYLVGSTTFRWAYLSLTRALVNSVAEQVDADVYNDYLRTRSVGLVPRLSVWWTPFLDHIFELAAFATTERDLTSLDYIGMTFDWRSLLPVLGGTAAEIIYRPTWRFQNFDRDAAFTRHDLTASLRWSIWTGRAGRVALGTDLAVFISSRTGVANTFTFIVRYDLTSGRALHDYLPPEQNFDTLVEGLRWEPTPPGVL
jgi:hypothetical protein